MNSYYQTDPVIIRALKLHRLREQIIDNTQHLKELRDLQKVNKSWLDQQDLNGLIAWQINHLEALREYLTKYQEEPIVEKWREDLFRD